VIAAAALVVGAGLIVIGGLAWTARLLRIGMLDAVELAEKVAAPHPASATDWPELRVLAVVKPDIPGERAAVLLQVEWPAHPDRTSTLLLDLGEDADRALGLLEQWCAEKASVSPARRGDDGLDLRRRQGLDRVRVRLLTEDYRDGDQGRDRPPSGRPGARGAP
jgi:hypothetical protein